MKLNTAGLILQSIRKAHGLSQYEMALKGKTFQANVSSIESGKTDPGISTLETFIAPLGYSLIAIPTRRAGADKLALDVAEELRTKKFDNALRAVIQLNNNLLASDPVIKIALCMTPPIATQSKEFDALIAGICDYYLTKENLPLPTWIQDPSRVLQEEWVVDRFEKNIDSIRARTPQAIRRHNVLFAESELQSI
jgi:transcriptional regulator with XRE-family HTH domain